MNKYANPEEWGQPLPLRKYKESKLVLGFAWFIVGLAVATIVLHFVVIAPLLNNFI